MADDNSAYALRGGKVGYDRLLLLSRDRWPDTAALFKRAGLATGMRCVDVGCGGGEVTQEIARWVSPSGSVVGIDMDAIKLDLATKSARDRGITNVAFRRMNVDDWNEPEAYDACYSRLLLEHLKHPWEVLRRMWTSLRPEGILMVEDVDWEGWSSDPVNRGLEFLRERYIKLLEHRGTDPRIGRRFFRQSFKLGIHDPQILIVNPVYTRGETKVLPRLTLEVTAEAMIADGIATREEVDAAHASLEELVADPHSLITGPKYFQLSARKSGPRVA